MTPALHRVGAGFAVAFLAVFVVVCGAFVGAAIAWLIAVLHP